MCRRPYSTLTRQKPTTNPYCASCPQVFRSLGHTSFGYSLDFFGFFQSGRRYIPLDIYGKSIHVLGYRFAVIHLISLFVQVQHPNGPCRGGGAADSVVDEKYRKNNDY